MQIGMSKRRPVWLAQSKLGYGIRMESKEEARIGSEHQLKEVDSCSKCNEIPRVVFKQGSDMV